MMSPSYTREKNDIKNHPQGWFKVVDNTAKTGGQPFMAGICAANVLTAVSQTLPHS